MNIAVIGTGNVGRALGTRLTLGGHRVVFGTRDPESERVRTLLAEVSGDVEAGPSAEAVQDSEVVILATPWGVTREAVESLGDLHGKILVDCTNPLKPNLDGLDVEQGLSGGEQVAQWAEGARVVKALNTTGAGNMADPALNEDHRLAILLCGDDVEAKQVVGSLIGELGFSAVDAGPLSRSGLLENMALLWILLAYQQGLGTDFGFAIVTRSGPGEI
jgi:predicted dinucleotide-binding enzyme